MLFASLSPAFVSLEGWLGLGLCFTLFNLSTSSLGKKSIAHSWLFTSLILWSPSDVSVAKIDNVSGSKSRRGKGEKVPKTFEERLDALQMKPTPVQPGMLALTSINSNKATQFLWTTLDKSVAYVFCCILILGLRWILAWERVIRRPCCNDYDCWTNWLASREEATPLLGFMTLLALAQVLTLGKITTKLPTGSRLRYPPETYVASYLMFGCAFWFSHTPPLLNRMNMLPFYPAVNELAARLLLWARLAGVETEDEQAAVESLSGLGHLIASFLSGCFIFVLSEPLATTIKLFCYHAHAGLKTKGGPESIKRRFFRYYQIVAMLSIAVLPSFGLFSYFYTFDKMPSRPFLAWLFVGLMASVTKPILQSFLDQGLPAVTFVLKQPKPTAEDIQLPFHTRISQLLKVGSQLAVFPCLLVVLLTMGHLCSNYNPTSGIYPGVYGTGVLDENESYMAAIDVWRQTSLVGLTHSSLESSSILSPTRGHTCGEPLELERRLDKEEEGLPLNASELLSKTPPVPITIAQVMKGLQQAASDSQQEAEPESKEKPSKKKKKNKEESPVDDDADKAKFTSLWKAFILHPVLSSTIVLPLLDFVGFILCFFWTFRLFKGWFHYSTQMKQLAAISFEVIKHKTKRS